MALVTPNPSTSLLQQSLDRLYSGITGASGTTTTAPQAGNVPVPADPASVVTLSTAATELYANYLLYGSAWQGSSTPGDPNNSLALTYSFLDPAYNYYQINPEQITHAATKSAFATALNAWASVTNLSFTETTEAGATVGSLRMGIDPMHNTAYAYLPINGQGALSGDIFLGERGISYDWTSNLAPGGWNYTTMLHEVGHALGFRHPHEIGRDAALFTSRGTNGKVWDQLKYTVMSYRDSQGASVKSGYTIDFYPTTLMLNDIAAAQYLYGIGTNNSGDTTYTFGAAQRFFQTIYDTGGTDTIDATAQALDTRLDLRAGKFSTIGDAINWRKGAKQMSGRDFVAIAYGSVIENAKGGSGHDTFYGNAAGNTFEGGAGNDTFVVNPDNLINGGTDHVDGGSGGDTLVLPGFGTGSSWSVSENGGIYTFTSSTGYEVTAGNIEFIALGEKGVRVDIDDVPASFTSAELIESVNRHDDSGTIRLTTAATIDGRPAAAGGMRLFQTARGEIFFAKSLRTATLDTVTGLAKNGIQANTAVTSLIDANGDLLKLAPGDILRATTRAKTGESTLYIESGGSLKVLDFNADGNQTGSTNTVVLDGPEIADIELKLKKDLNGDGVKGARITQALSTTSPYSLYRANSGGSDYYAFAAPKLVAGKALSPTAVTLKNADGSAWAGTISNYQYSTMAGKITGITLNGGALSFDAKGYLQP